MRVVGASLLVAVLTAITPTPAGAAQRWATPTALRSSGPCLAIDPCTLAAALTGATTGDEILLGSGRYVMPAPLTAPVRVTLRGAEAERPVIVGSETSEDHAVLTFKTGGTLRHVEIRAEQGQQDALELPLRGGVAEDLVLFSTGGNGAEVFGASGGTVLRDTLARTAVQGDDDRAALRLREDSGDVLLRNVTALAPGASGVRCSLFIGTATLVNTLARGAKDIRASSFNHCTASHSNFRPAVSPYLHTGSGNQRTSRCSTPTGGRSRVADDRRRRDRRAGRRDRSRGLSADGRRGADIGAYEYVDADCAVAPSTHRRRCRWSPDPPYRTPPPRRCRQRDSRRRTDAGSAPRRPRPRRAPASSSARARARC